MPQACQIGPKCRSSEVVEASAQGARDGRRDRGFERGKHALAVGLAKRDEAAAGRNPVRYQRVKESEQCGRKRDRVNGADNADGDWIGNGAVALPDRMRKAIAIPGRPRDLDKRTALRGGFELPLARRHERCRKLGDIMQGTIVIISHRAMGMREKDSVAEAGALDKHRSKPILERRGIADVASLHRPFDAAGIGEAADWERRREPRHQPVQRRRFAFGHRA